MSRSTALPLLALLLSGCLYDKAIYDERKDLLTDHDGDGVPLLEDCDDEDDTIYPGAVEIPADGIDQDCNSEDTCYVDSDYDGYGKNELTGGGNLDCTDHDGETDNADDCDDDAIAVHPGATETPGDGVDQDCDGEEICYLDADEDGYGSATEITGSALDCDATKGESSNDDDCADEDASRHPGAADPPGDSIDQDCDGNPDG